MINDNDNCLPIDFRYVYVTTEQASENMSLLNHSKLFAFFAIIIPFILGMVHWIVFVPNMAWHDFMYVLACVAPTHNTRYRTSLHTGTSYHNLIKCVCFSIQ